MENKYEIEITENGIKRKLTYDGEIYEDYMVKEGYIYKTLGKSIETQLEDDSVDEEFIDAIIDEDLANIMDIFSE